MIDLNDVQYDTFKPFEGRVFRIGPNGEAELTLAEVTSGGPSPSEGLRPPFYHRRRNSTCRASVSG